MTDWTGYIRLSDDDFARLRRAGVSQASIDAMLATRREYDLAVIDEFRNSTFPNEWYEQDGGEENLPVTTLLDPDEAMGRCDVITDLFVAFLAERGIEAHAVETTARTLGLVALNRYGAEIDDAEHYVARVGNVYVDWTASQFGGSGTEFPRITEVK